MKRKPNANAKNAIYQSRPKQILMFNSMHLDCISEPHGKVKIDLNGKSLLSDFAI